MLSRDALRSITGTLRMLVKDSINWKRKWLKGPYHELFNQMERTCSFEFA